MISPTRFIRCLVCAIPAYCLAAASATAQERIEARLPSGRSVEVTLHRPVSALTSAVRVGDAVIAATEGGGLLRFEGADQHVANERWDPERTIACLGRGEGDAVLAGLSDGRVGRIDPTTLEWADLARLPKQPSWVGWVSTAAGGKGGVVAVVAGVVHDLATGRSIDTKDSSTTALVDRQGRLWIGGDKGEWGGRVARVDLRNMTFLEIPPPPRTPETDYPGAQPYWPGVYGFVEFSDGQLWAFGGTMHMGTTQARITRVDRLVPQTLFAYDTPEVRGGPDPARPTMPITHVVEDGDGLLVVAYSNVFRVDRGLQNWNRSGGLRVRYEWGRRDAVGAYPAVRALLPPSREGGAFLAAASEGLIAVNGPEADVHLIPDRLGASRVARIENTAEGVLFIEDDGHPVWKLGPRGWRPIDIGPPFEIDPASDAPQFERDFKGWNRTHVLVGPGGTIYTVSDFGLDPGTVATARREEGRAVVIGRETSYVGASRSFITPDGTLWNSDDWLRRFSGGRWRRVAQLEHGSPDVPVVIPTQGPPWMIYNPEVEMAPSSWRLNPGKGDTEPRLDLFIIPKGGEDTGADHGAIAWTNGAVLLSTDVGLRTLDTTILTLGKVDLPNPPEPTSILTRDGLGRVWFGGEQGLSLAAQGAKAVENFEDVRNIRNYPITALAPDPDHPDGVIVSLGSRGVAFVRAAR